MKKLLAKTGTYTKNGEQKNEWTKIGVQMENDNGPYLLLDACVSLAGVLEKQNILASKQGKEIRSSVMVSVFEEEQNQENKQSDDSGYMSQPAGEPAPTNDGFGDLESDQFR